jgi:septum formation protein
MTKRKIMLASRSPRRKRLLEQIGLKFEIRESEYEEDMGAKSDPAALVKFLAGKKAADVARHYTNAIVIGADTVVVLDNEILGKPKDKKEAKAMLRRLSGREHKVLTGLTIIDTANKTIFKYLGKARVKFRNLSEREIDDYIATGEPLDKAGAYGIQEKGIILIAEIRGDYGTVVGLPLAAVYSELIRLGINCFKN